VSVVTRRFLVRGRVQGVGYREFARRQALRFGVSGWVRNLGDGRSVEAVASGDDRAVALFSEAIRQGPGGAVVTEFRAEDYPDYQGDAFEVRM
jgi:acylphosphatase